MTTKNNETARRDAERACAGCGQRASADALVRVVVEPESGEVAVDMAGSGFGRGAHVHPTGECVAKAAKAGFSKAFKTKIVADATDLGSQIVLGADRRIEGLLSGARRARQTEQGADVVAEALRDGRVELVIVACDAAAAAKITGIDKAIAEGRAIAWKDKKSLGALFGRDEVGVCAVLHPGVAVAISMAYRMAGPFRSSLSRGQGSEAVPALDESSSRSGAWSSEVR